MQIKRTSEIELLNERFRNNPVVAILGPRQCGKTTLARQFSDQWPKDVTFFDLENPRDLRRLEEPLLALENLEGLIVLDEIQRAADLFPVLRVLADRPNKKAKFLILGSASRDLIRQSSESLAGRISYLEIGGFTLDLVGAVKCEKLWIRGAFPRSFLASNEAASYQWRQDFIATFLERDIPQLGFNIPAKSLGRFWQMLAHYHGQIFNASEIGKSLAVSTIPRKDTWICFQELLWFASCVPGITIQRKESSKDQRFIFAIQVLCMPYLTCRRKGTFFHTRNSAHHGKVSRWRKQSKQSG